MHILFGSILEAKPIISELEPLFCDKWFCDLSTSRAAAHHLACARATPPTPTGPTPRPDRAQRGPYASVLGSTLPHMLRRIRLLEYVRARLHATTGRIGLGLDGTTLAALRSIGYWRDSIKGRATRPFGGAGLSSSLVRWRTRKRTTAGGPSGAMDT